MKLQFIQQNDTIQELAFENADIRSSEATGGEC
jgi:hypothetical protein